MPATLTARNPDERREIFDQWHRLARLLARRAFGSPYFGPAIAARGFDLEDVEQAALAATWHATACWDPTLGQFGTYLGTVVKRHLQRELGIGGKRRVSFGSLTHSIDGGQIPVVDPKAPDPADVAAQREDVEALHDAMRFLSPDRRDIVWRIAAGETFTAVAAATGQSHVRVSQKHALAMVKLQIVAGVLPGSRRNASARH